MSNTEYLLNEIDRHMVYFKALNRKMDALSTDIEKTTKDVLRTADEGEKPSRDAFVSMNQMSSTINVVQMELVKTASRVALLFQIAVSSNLQDEIKKRPDYGMMERVAGDYENLFIKEEDGLVFADKVMEEALMKRASDIVPENNEEILNRQVGILREQFNQYNRIRDGIQETKPQ